MLISDTRPHCAVLGGSLWKYVAAASETMLILLGSVVFIGCIGYKLESHVVIFACIPYYTAVELRWYVIPLRWFRSKEMLSRSTTHIIVDLSLGSRCWKIHCLLPYLGRSTQVHWAKYISDKRLFAFHLTFYIKNWNVKIGFRAVHQFILE